MARSAPPSIATSLASPGATPELSATISDAFDRPDPLAITSGNAGRSALIQLADGTSYIHAYVNRPGTGVDAQVFTQIVTHAATPAQWETYNLRTSDANQDAGVALALFGSTIFLFFQRRSDKAIRFMTSNDGIGWSAAADVATTTACWAMASAGNDDLFLAVNHIPLDDSAQNVLLYTWDGATWTLADTWTNPPVQISGLSALWDGTAYRIAMGAQSRPDGALALCSMTRAEAAWSPITPIHPLDDPTTGQSAPFPGLALVDGRYRLTSTLYDDGTDTGTAGNHTEMWTSPDFTHWHLEQLLGRSFNNGCNPAPGPGGAGWIIGDASDIVLSQAAAGTTAPDIPISDRILSIHLHEPASATTRGHIVLSNEDGALTPTFPATTAMRVGAKLHLELGYDGTTVHTHTLYLDSIEVLNSTTSDIPQPGHTSHRTSRPAGPGPAPGQPTADTPVRYPADLSDTFPPGDLTDRADFSPDSIPNRTRPPSPTALIRLAVSNRARLLDRPTHTDRTHDGATLLYLATEIAISAGIHNAPTAAGHAQFSQTLDTFAVHTAATWATTLARLATVYGFEWTLDQDGQLTLAVPQAADTPTTTYATTQTTAHSLTPRRHTNSVRVVGAGKTGRPPPYAHDHDQAAIQEQGEIVHHQVADRLLTTSTKCAIRSQLELRRGQRSALSGQLTIPIDPRHQPLDVITISDDTASATARIAELHWTVDHRTGAYHQVAILEAP